MFFKKKHKDGCSGKINLGVNKTIILRLRKKDKKIMREREREGKLFLHFKILEVTSCIKMCFNFTLHVGN